jgi:uncharacterized protein
MLFNVSQLMREPLGARRQYAIDEEWSPDESTSVRLFGPVSLLRTDRGVLVTAVLASEAQGECDRCLKPLRYPVRMEFSEEYLPEVDPFTGARLPDPEEATPYRINSHHLLDLDEAVRQAWLLAQPMQTLCRLECAGLCPECGGDKNSQGCRCASGPVDPRWAALAALRGGADGAPKG